MRARLVEPSTRQILAYCADSPVERVFLEDVARRESGRFVALENGDGALHALCHLGTNVVPSGTGCDAFAEVAARVSPRAYSGVRHKLIDPEPRMTAAYVLKRIAALRPPQAVIVEEAPTARGPEPSAIAMPP